MRSTACAALFLLVAPACGGVAQTPSAAPTATPHPTPPPATPSPTPRPLAEPIRLSPLPPEGFVAGAPGGVVFLDLEGRVVDNVLDLELAGNGGPAAIWARRGPDYFRLDVDGHVLVPVPRGRARSAMSRSEEEVSGLPPPPGAPSHGGDVAGHWRYVFEGPGGVTLAQWSGECESPTAWWIEPGRRPELVTGGGMRRALSSFALGWSGDGRAFVYLPEGACGGSLPTAGIYRVAAPGDLTLVYATKKLYAGAGMWTR